MNFDEHHSTTEPAETEKCELRLSSRGWIAFSFWAVVSPCWGATQYLYTLDWQSAAAMAETQLEFSPYIPVTGVRQAAAQVEVDAPSFPGAILRDDLNTFRFNASLKALIVTLDTLSVPPLRAPQFCGQFPISSACRSFARHL